MIEAFHGFVMFSLNLSKIGWILFSNAKETLEKMLLRWPENVHIDIMANMWRIENNR